uniref:WWE domain-containing protein n=1 Tax=Clastoptera arizonana TaxID=38151 RepID=A0A1B6C5Y3_9HEMI
MANRNKYDNNLKSFENPLLSAAAAEFPIENFTNNTFLLPISHQTKDDIPADIEEDSFLGQNPKPSSNEPLFKAFGSAQSQRVEAQNTDNKQNISFYNPTLFQSSNPHSTSTKSQHPIPEFTQSIVSSLPPYKPTIQNPLVQNFQGLNLNSTPGVRQAPSPNTRENQSCLFPQQTAHSHSDLSNLTLHSKIPSQPVTESVSLRSSPGATTHLFTPLPVSSSISEPNLCPINASTSLTNTFKDSIGIQSEQNASVPLLSSPSVPQSSSFISTNQQINPLPSLFSTSQSPKSHFALYNPNQPQPQSSSVLGTVTDLNGPLLHSSFTPNPQIPLFNPSSSTINKPSSGTVPNTYRLSNLKRPVYTRPPDLAVSTPIMTNIDTITPPSLPPQASLFTPAPVQSECPEEIYNASTPATLPPNIQTSHDSQTAVVPPSFASLAQGLTYRPVYHHWFFRKDIEGKVLWHPFSMTDSLALEAAFTSPNISPDTKVATDGGRYDVDVLRRRRIAVYWEEDAREVRRCSWFVKGSIDARYIPYEESIATMLEDEYRQVSSTNEWNKQVNLPDGEVIIFHSPNAIAHHSRSSSPDAWGNAPQMQQKPRIVKRGMDEFDISEGEPEKVDHLLFLVHGIGKFCDLKFRPVAEVVDDFRSICLQLLQSHFKGAIETGTVSRIEVLPVPWHQALHSEDITKKTKQHHFTKYPTTSSIHQ